MFHIFTTLKLWLHSVLCSMFKMSNLLLPGIYARRQIFKCRAAEKQQNASTPNNHRGHCCGRDNMVFQPGQGRQGDTAHIIGSQVGYLNFSGLDFWPVYSLPLTRHESHSVPAIFSGSPVLPPVGFWCDVHSEASLYQSLGL